MLLYHTTPSEPSLCLWTSSNKRGQGELWCAHVPYLACTYWYGSGMHSSGGSNTHSHVNPLSYFSLPASHPLSVSAMPPKFVQDLFDQACQRGSNQKTGIVSNDPIKKTASTFHPRQLQTRLGALGLVSRRQLLVLAAMPLPVRANQDEQLRVDSS